MSNKISEIINSFMENFTSKGDISGIKRTNSYYRNLAIIEHMTKRDKIRKKEEKKKLKEKRNKRH